MLAHALHSILAMKARVESIQLRTTHSAFRRGGARVHYCIIIAFYAFHDLTPGSPDSQRDENAWKWFIDSFQLSYQPESDSNFYRKQRANAFLALRDNSFIASVARCLIQNQQSTHWGKQCVIRIMHVAVHNRVISALGGHIHDGAKPLCVQK